MAVLSKALFETFQVVNEAFTLFASGVTGPLILFKNGLEQFELLRIVSIVAFTGWCFAYYFKENNENLKPDKQKVVVITGCDSGLGFSLCQHVAQSGFTVIAGFLSLDSNGAKAISSAFGDSIKKVKLDITDQKDICNVVKSVQHFLSSKSDYSLYAVVNNSGIMVFGEFEWLTDNLIDKQIEINLMGTLKVTKAFCPLLRQHKARLITVTSHCALATLPGLSVYGATKTALAAWSDGLRVELAKYGVNVINFIPGSFVTQSNIMSRQLQYAQEMHDNFTEEQHAFYSEYFKSYNLYLSYISAPKDPTFLDDSELFKEFDKALLQTKPKVVYKRENLRYKFYHFLFKFSPTYWLRDYFIVKFMKMPPYVPPIDFDQLSE